MKKVHELFRKDHIICASEKAYINTGQDLFNREQCWKMMNAARMIEIFDYSLATHKLTTEERLKITEVKLFLRSKSYETK